LKPKQTTIKNNGRFSVTNQRGVGDKKASGAGLKPLQKTARKPVLQNEGAAES